MTVVKSIVAAPKSGIRIPTPGGVLSAADVEANFADVAPAMTRPEALAESGRCLFCYDAPCMIACPTHIDVPGFIKKIQSDNLRGSARVILDANPMGHSCARACPVEVLCEGSCVMHLQGSPPIQIARLQRHATDALLAAGWPVLTPAPSTGRRVAVIGAGPAGLSCTQHRRRRRHPGPPARRPRRRLRLSPRARRCLGLPLRTRARAQ